MLVFRGKGGRKTVQKVKTTAVAKHYGFERHTIFSTEGSFGKEHADFVKQARHKNATDAAILERVLDCDCH